MRKSLSERFYERVHPEPNSGCLLWRGGYTVAGYGLLYVGSGKTVYALWPAYLTASELPRKP